MCYGWGSLNGIISSSHYSIKFCQNNKLELLQYISYISIYFDIFFWGSYKWRKTPRIANLRPSQINTFSVEKPDPLDESGLGIAICCWTLFRNCQDFRGLWRFFGGPNKWYWFMRSNRPSVLRYLTLETIYVYYICVYHSWKRRLTYKLWNYSK